MKARALTLVGLTLSAYCPLINCACEKIPEDCTLKEDDLQYTCYVTGAHGNDVFRQLQLTNQITGGNIDHIKVEATPPEMNDVELSYNNRYILLHFRKGYYQPSHDRILLLTLTTYSRKDFSFGRDVLFIETNYHLNVTIRSFDLQISEEKGAENQEMIIRCSILGLYPDETELELRFNDQKRYSCDDWQPTVLTTDESSKTPYIVRSNDGITCELHIPASMDSFNGEYYCRGEILMDESKCLFVQSQRILVETFGSDEINTAPVNSTSSGDMSIRGDIIIVTITAIVTALATTVVVLATVMISFYTYKHCLRKNHQETTSQDPQQPDQVSQRDLRTSRERQDDERTPLVSDAPGLTQISTDEHGYGTIENERSSRFIRRHIFGHEEAEQQKLAVPQCPPLGLN